MHGTVLNIKIPVIIYISIFDIRSVSVFNVLLWSKPSLAFGTLANIRFSISKLTFNARHGFEYQNTISIYEFDIRTASVIENLIFGNVPNAKEGFWE